MMPYEDSTLISLVLACCEDPTHPIEPLSDWIQEQEYPEYRLGTNIESGPLPPWDQWYESLKRKAYRAGCMPRNWFELLQQLRDLGTWEEMG